MIYAAPQILGLVGQVQLNLSLADTAGHTLWQIGMTLDSSNANIGGVQSSALSVVVQKGRAVVAGRTCSERLCGPKRLWKN